MLDIVLMCGGNGTRLWPLSRELLPKQFIKLTDENTMFQLTCKRIANIDHNTLYVICNEKHQFIAQQQLEEIRIHNYKIICEPMGKNTAGAIAVACGISTADNLLVLSSDHVWNDAKFILGISKGLDMVKDNIVVFGIKPTYSETGYGYIKFEDNNLLQFVEKPNLDKAKEYVESGEYLWNSGTFLFDREIMHSALKSYAEDIYCDVAETLENTDLSSTLINLNKEYFSKIRSESIDFAVMEHLSNAKVVKYEGYWTDVGSFKALFDHNKKDADNNYITNIDNSICLNTTNTFIDSYKTVATIGVDNLAIIDTKDALLITDKDLGQEIKTVVGMLKNTHKELTTNHTKVFRPWGWYDSIEGDDYSGYKVKRICVYPKKRLSLQSHNKRSEHWVIIKGSLKIQIGNDFHILHKNQSIYIPIGVLHRAENLENEEAELIETQIGEYLGEDDIVRYEDDWGRK